MVLWLLFSTCFSSLELSLLSSNSTFALTSTTYSNWSRCHFTLSTFISSDWYFDCRYVVVYRCAYCLSLWTPISCVYVKLMLYISLTLQQATVLIQLKYVQCVFICNVTLQMALRTPSCVGLKCWWLSHNLSTYPARRAVCHVFNWCWVPRSRSGHT